MPSEAEIEAGAATLRQVECRRWNCQKEHDKPFTEDEKGTAKAVLDAAEAVRPAPIGYVVLTRKDDHNRSLVATLAEAFADCADQDREWPQDGPHRVCALLPVEQEDTE